MTTPSSPTAGLSVADITVDPAAYSRVRPERRSQMMALRAARRVSLGDVVTLEFENVDTLRYQVQEMVYVERLSAPGDLAHEVDVYSRLLPTSHELSATLFLALTSAATAKDELRTLDGIQHAIRLRIGEEEVPASERPGADDAPDASETSSVHMLRFSLTDAQRDAFRDPAVPAAVQVTHPAYDDEAPLTGPTRLALIADLALARPA